jgi:hypothetical protein
VERMQKPAALIQQLDELTTSPVIEKLRSWA